MTPVSFLHAGILLKHVSFHLNSCRLLPFVLYLNFWDPIHTNSLISICILLHLGVKGTFGGIYCSILFRCDMQPFLLPYSLDHAGLSKLELCNCLRPYSEIGRRILIVLRFSKYIQNYVFPSQA